MYAIYAYIDLPNHPNVGIYGIHGVYGKLYLKMSTTKDQDDVRLDDVRTSQEVWSEVRTSNSPGQPVMSHTFWEFIAKLEATNDMQRVFQTTLASPCLT